MPQPVATQPLELPDRLPMQFRFTEIGELKRHLRKRAAGAAPGAAPDDPEDTMPGDPGDAPDGSEIEPDAYDIVLTTDTPVDQGWCLETLGHDPGECDLSYAQRGISFMLEHGNQDYNKPAGFRDPEFHLGIIEELSVAGGQLTGVARFAADDALSPTALRVKRDWASGKPTRPFLSGGYVPIARTIVEPTKEGQPTQVRWTRWQIREESNVALPADPTAGKTRSAEADLYQVQNHFTQRSQEDTKMPEPTVIRTPPAPAAASPDGVAVLEERMKARADESAQIVSLCVAQNCAARAAEFIQQGKTLAEVKNVLFDELHTRTDRTAARGPGAEALQGLSPKERRRYSYRKAALIALRSRGGLALENSLELDVHRELLKLRSQDAIQSQYGGILVPFDLRSEEEILDAMERKLATRTMGTNVAAKGLEWVAQQTMPLVEILEATAVLVRLGANLNTALTGNLSYPRETGQPTVSFLGENPASGVSAADGQTGEILSGPKTMVGAVKMSRQWLFQTAGAGESRVRNALINGTARALDKNGLTGTGSGTVPLGLYNIPAMQSVGMSNLAPTYPLICQMFGKIADQNADSERCGVVTSASMAWLLKSKLLASNVPGFIWDGPVYDGQVAGYRGIGSTQAIKTLGSGSDEHVFAVGNWAYCDVNLWGATEIVVDELTAGDSAQVVIRSYGMGDVVFTHPEAFCVATAAKLA